MDGRGFDSWELAQFVAYMTDSYPIKDSKSRFVKLWTLAEGKKEIDSLISKGDYTAIHMISEYLSKPVSFTADERSKSWRVEFDQYVSFLYEALSKRIALGDAVKRDVTSSLEKAITWLSARNDINRDKLSLLQKEFSSWREQGVEKRKSYTKRSRGEGEPTGQKDGEELGAVDALHEDYYHPYYLVYGDNAPVEALRELLIQSEIKRLSGNLPVGVLEKLFGVTRTSLQEDGIDEVDDLRQMFPLIILNAGGKGLKIQFSYSDNLMTRETFEELDRLFPDFDDKTLEKIRVLSDCNEGADGEEFCHSAESGVIASIDLNVNRAGVFLGGLQVTDDENAFRKALMEKLAPSTDEDLFRRQLSEATEKENMVMVNQLTKDFERNKEARRLVDFALDSILPLVRRTQSVSFRAPDLLIRAWEGYRSIESKSTSKGKEV